MTLICHLGATLAGFSVNLASLQALQASLQRRVDDVSAIRQHFTKIDSSVFGSGAFLLDLRSSFEAVLQHQISTAVDAQLAVQNAANQVQNSRQYYCDTDEASAARFDATLPGTPEAAFNENTESTEVYAGPYHDVNTPLARLIEPPDYDSEMTWAPSLASDLGNVTSFVRAVVKLILGKDPLEVPEQLLSGNWKELRRIADRFNNVAWCFYDSCDDIYSCQNDSTHDWIGNTGDNVRAFLVYLAAGFYGEYRRNEWLAMRLTKLADDLFEGMKTLVDIVSDWVNAKLIPALAGLGIAAATEEVPIADFITTGAAGFQAYEAIKAGIEVLDQANHVKNIIDSFVVGLNVGQDGQVNIDVDDAPLIPNNADTYATPVGY